MFHSDTITLDALSDQITANSSFRVEIQALDLGWYFVRLHSKDTQRVLTLVDNSGETRRFTGTQWVSRALRPLGFTEAMLTWPSVTDEMVGSTTPAATAEEVMAHGTRVALQTD